jgi:hypothetical protein
LILDCHYPMSNSSKFLVTSSKLKKSTWERKTSTKAWFVILSEAKDLVYMRFFGFTLRITQKNFCPAPLNWELGTWNYY